MSEPLLREVMSPTASSGCSVDGARPCPCTARFGVGVASRREVEALLSLAAACGGACGTWPASLIEEAARCIVHRDRPSGSLTGAKAAWLTGAIAKNGRIETVAGFDLLVRVLENAGSAPTALALLALEEVALAVVDGAGPLARGRASFPGIIEAAEVDLIRRILKPSYGGREISRAEADVLFRINDGTVEEMNDPSWNTLFVRTITGHVLAGDGQAGASLEDDLLRGHLLDAADLNLMAYFRRMVAGGAGVLFDRAGSERAGRDGGAPRLGESEARWLAGRIGHDGLIHDNERVLLALIAAQAADPHPCLAPLLAKVA
jgi:hypothetical protein